MTDQPTNCITLNSPPTEEVLRLDEEGFHYRGQFIADAGEAHRLMVEFLRQQTQLAKPTDKELCEAYRAAYYACENRQGPTAQAFALRAVLKRWGCQ
jgi:hypothetical protein